jgi:hypothetical protein
MSFFKEIAPFSEFLHSVRRLEDYLSFDIKFPMSWGLPKSMTESEGIIPFDSGSQSLKGISFVCKIEEDQIKQTISKIEKVIKLNRDKELKEKLFRETIDTLKKTFETTDHLNWLKSEQQKDQRELELEKQKLLKEIKNLNKTDLFPKKPKITLWQRLKIALIGQ